MKLGVLCNNPVAFPALQWLRGQGISVAVGTDARNVEMVAALQAFCLEAGYVLTLFSAADFEIRLLLWLEEARLAAVLMKTFPFRIPSSALNVPVHGFLNFHYGLLPRYRGANPVFEQIRRRERVGGITVHRVDAGIDTGPVVAQQTIPIAEGETFGMHMQRLAALDVEITAALLPSLSRAKRLDEVPQEASEARYFKKPGEEDVNVDWQKMAAADIAALADACNPWNYGAGTKLAGATLGINAAMVCERNTAHANAKPGTILSTDARRGLTVATADGAALRLDVLYVNGGYMPGYRLALYGIPLGAYFH